MLRKPGKLFPTAGQFARFTDRRRIVIPLLAFVLFHSCMDSLSAVAQERTNAKSEAPKVAARDTLKTIDDLQRHFDSLTVSTLPVDVIATLTYADRDWGVFYVQEGSAGVFVRIDKKQSASAEEWKLGMRVRIIGSARSQQFTVENAELSIVGPGELPEPKSMSMATMTQWENSSHWVSTAAVVDTVIVSPAQDRCVLLVHDEGRSAMVRIQGIPDAARASHLKGATIRIVGVMGAHLAVDGHWLGPLLYVMDPNNIQITAPGSRRSTMAEVISPGRLRDVLDKPDAYADRIIQFDGQVKHRVQDTAILVEDSGAGILIPMLATNHIDNGAYVTATGTVRSGANGVVLDALEIRVAGSNVPDPAEVSARTIVDERINTRLVVVTGVLQRVIPGVTAQRLIIDSDGIQWEASISRSEYQAYRHELDDADTVQCTGLCQFDHLDPSSAFRMDIVSSADIVATSRFLKMDRHRLVLSAIGLVGVAGFVLVWLTRLKRDAGRSEKRLSELASRLQASFDSVHEAVFIIDAQNRIAEHNQAAEHLVSMGSLENVDAGIVFDRLCELLNSPWQLVQRRQQFVQPDSAAETSLDECSPLRLEATARDGRVFKVLFAGIHEDPSLSSGRIWVFHDITERKRLEEQLMHSQRLDSLGRLAGGIAHEFNNILMAISGNQELAMDVCHDRPLALEFLASSRAATRRASAQVARILEFSRSNTLELKNAMVNALVDRVVGMLRSSLNPDVVLQIEMAADVPAIALDESRIEQVVLNLCLNARDALPATGGAIRIETAVEADNVRISVEDNGAGMEDRVRQRIFDPFYTTKGPGKGTGLGLSLSYGIVQQHGGRINCVSSPGNGSRFDVLLPCSSIVRLTEDSPHEDSPHTVESVDIQPSHERHSQSPGDDLIGTGHILIVDDDASVRTTLGRILSVFGYLVSEASNGLEAIELLRTDECRDVRLVLLDLTMPVLSGRDTFLRMRQKWPCLPVVLCSGYTDQLVVLSDVESPPEAVLSKPVARTTLLKTVRDVLVSAPAAQQAIIEIPKEITTNETHQTATS